jgi:hypothetical protein
LWRSRLADVIMRSGRRRPDADGHSGARKLTVMGQQRGSGQLVKDCVHEKLMIDRGLKP